MGAGSLSGGIAGVVRDTTGAVLPGVTVEASSPALIEKVRVVVTDNRYGPQWWNAIGILAGRVWKFSAQLDF